MDRHDNAKSGKDEKVYRNMKKENITMLEKWDIDEMHAFNELFLKSYISAYYVNLTDGSFKLCKQSDVLRKKGPELTDFVKAVSENIGNYVNPDDAAALMEFIQPDRMKKMLEAEEEASCTFRGYTVQGEGYYRVHAVRGADENHAAVGFRKVIAELKEPEKQLLGTTTLAPDILEKANIGLWAFELDEGKPPRMYVDSTMLGLIGLTEQISPEETYHAWYDHIDQGSYDMVADSVERMTNGEHAEVQYPWHHPDGHTLIVRCGGMRNYAYRSGIRIEGTHQDVTETIHFDEDEKSRQRHLKSFGDMINAALWEMDINDDDKIINVNWSNEFRRMFGFREAVEDFPNTVEAWSDRLHPDDREETMDDFYKGISSRDVEGFVYDIEYRIRRKSGEYCWYHALGRMENGPKGTRRMYGIINDISADKELEEKQNQLAEALAMAESSNRAKTTFLNNMSHDIRTPMNAIIGYTGLAASHIDNREQVQDYLTKIAQSSDHLLSLINDVLDMSRIESGKMNLEEKPESLSEIIHTLRDIVLHDIQSKGLEFFVDAVDVNDEDVICDKLRLNQVLLNIISNSIKYTAAGGMVSLRVTEKTISRNGYATYEFCVKDSGMGMTPEFLQHIFDPFERAKSTTMSGIQGTGLGMSITKNIVDMMGGSIDIKSSPGKGTEVSVSLDFKLGSVPKELERIPELSGMRALVVDDDSGTCISIAKMIRDIGMRDEWCTSGREAVIRAEEAYHRGDLFRVYVIDWLMPDMNGVETTRRIRRVIGDDVPIIVLTAYDWADIEEEAKEAGVTAFVSKPMFPSDLHRVLNICMGREEEQEQPSAMYEFEGKKVLLVEDNELNREIAEEILKENGLHVETAEDGDVAVDIMKAAEPGEFDLILMDIQMPNMDGYEATRHIRAIESDVSEIPIIAMTANAFEEDRRIAMEAGMDEHVAKPIDIERLKKVMAQFI